MLPGLAGKRPEKISSDKLMKGRGRQAFWVELTPGLLCLHPCFLGEALSMIPTYQLDLKTETKLERKKPKVSKLHLSCMPFALSFALCCLRHV